MDFSYETLASRVVFGRGVAVQRIVEVLDELGARSIILIIGLDTADVRAVDAALGDRVIVRFSDPRPHVPAELAEALRAEAARYELDAIVSVGGGSTTGAAKILALTTGLPIVAVPTTYAGSEVTPIWGMTTNGEKRTGRDPKVQPRVVLYDEALFESLPRQTAVASALNAMAHCIDGYWAPGANPVSAALGTEALAALAQGLRLIGSGSTAASTEHLLYGSYLAGVSFAVTGSGLHHKICHALGGAFDLPHAQLHAVMLPAVLAFNLPEVPAAAPRIATALGVDDAIAGLRELYTLVDAPSRLTQIGLGRDDRDRAVDIIASRLPIPNPRPVDREAIAQIIDGAIGL